MSIFSKIFGIGIIAGAGWLWYRNRGKRNSGQRLTAAEASAIVKITSVSLVNEFYQICFQNGKMKSSITAAQKKRLSWILLNMPVTAEGKKMLKELTGLESLPDVRLFFTSAEYSELQAKFNEYPSYFQYIVSNPRTIASAAASFDVGGEFSTDDVLFPRGEFIGRTLKASNNVFYFYSIGNNSRTLNQLKRMKIGGNDIFTVS